MRSDSRPAAAERAAAAGDEVVLRNPQGMQVGLSPVGASLRSLELPLAGRVLHPVLGLPAGSDPADNPFFIGSTVGRVAGRIDHGAFSLAGRRYALATGTDTHCLHGGPGGFHARRWTVTRRTDREVEFGLVSPDGEQGFPGELQVAVCYRIADDASSLSIELSAVCDAPTVVNLTNHAYFNLAGAGTIDTHWVRIEADRYTPLREDLIPTGEIRDVTATAYDLRRFSPLLPRLARLPGGFDINYALSSRGGARMQWQGAQVPRAASVWSPTSMLRLDLFTDQPGLQFYTGNFLDTPFVRRGGLCLEAQGFPDAPNQPSFPSVALTPGDTYRRIIVLAFRRWQPARGAALT